MTYRKSIMAWRVVVCFCVLLSGLGCAAVRTYSENELYASELWKNTTVRLMVLRSDSPLPSEYAGALEFLLTGTWAAVVKVSCVGGGGEVCSLLLASPAVVRGEEGRWSVGEVIMNGQLNQFLLSALESLLGPSLILVPSFPAYHEFAEQNEKHIVAFSPNRLLQEYLSLLAAALSFPSLPHTLVVAMTKEALPLTRRPLHSSSPPPLSLWFVLGHDWHECQDGLWDRGRLVKFMARMQFPAVLEYTGDPSPPPPSPLHPSPIPPLDVRTAYIFHPPGRQEEMMAIARGLASKLFDSFIFYTVDKTKHSDLLNQFHVTSRPEDPYIVVTSNQEEDGQLHHISPEHIPFTVSSLLGALDSLQRGWEEPVLGVESNRGQVPDLLLTTVESFEDVVEERGGDSLVVFCGTSDSMECERLYQRLDRMVVVLGEVGGGKGVTAVLVECDENSLNITFPLMKYYSSSADIKWQTLRNDASVADMLRVVMEHHPATLPTGLLEKLEDDSYELSVGGGGGIPLDGVFQSSYLEEDDHFGLLVRSLPPADSSPHLHLTDKTFAEHIASHDPTLVVFYLKWCVKCKVFLHHVMAAVEFLDPALSGSLMLVSCGDYTDICYQQNISSFPSVLLYHGSPLHPSPLTGAMDSQRLLEALREHSEQDQNIPEVRSDTLPSLLQGALSSPLILWCDRDLGNKMADSFARLIRRQEQGQQLLIPGWINSEKYSKLLHKLLEDFSSPAVIIVDFKQRTVYQLSLARGRQFEDELQSFLLQFSEGTLEPAGTLPPKKWPPLRPAIPFPSGQDHLHQEHGEERRPSETHRDSDRTQSGETERGFLQWPHEAPPPSSAPYSHSHSEL